MKKQEKIQIEKRIKEETEQQTPNDFSKVLLACKSNNTSRGKILKMKTNRTAILVKIAGIAAAFVILLSICIGIYAYANTTQAIISFDVNPGIEIVLGRKDKVLKISATNDDGEAIVTDLDVKGKTLDEAIDMMLDKFIESGYVSEEANSVLVSVNSKKIKDIEQMSARITESINAKLSAAGVEASILTQITSEHDEIEALAEEYNMSFGKARLIYQLVEKDGRHTFEELSSLTVHELNMLLRETKLIPEDVKTEGEASEMNLITKEEALKIALESVELTEEDVTNIEIEFDYLKSHGAKKGIMVYDIEFETEDTEFDFDIDVKTGEILKSKSGEMEFDDEDGEKPENPDDKEPKDEPAKKDEKDAYKPEKRPENLIGKGEAFKQAFENEGVAPNELGDIDCDVSFKDGKWHYEFEFDNGQGKQKVKVDALTGDVIAKGKK